ncbi:hypothetical protein ACH4UM_24060 [Streptomyces sp. NPDC020801]|uniref:hypothetical protein n=1 Tax=unclassified Streptomyces TaxID=2593676 RepID=UPI0037B9F25A
MSDDMPRRFHLQRRVDVTGASGTGRVADGVLWPDGTATLRWRGERASTVFWDNGMEDAEAVHGHGGHTRIIWDDPAGKPPMANWVDAWSVLASWVDEAVADGREISVAEIQARMRELKERAVAPVSDWLTAKPVAPRADSA